MLRDVVTLLVQAVVLILAGVAFGLRAPLAGVLIGLGFIAVVAVSLSALSYTVGLLLKSEDALAPLINMIVVPLTLLSGIMLPLTLGPGWLQGIARATPFRYIIDAMRAGLPGRLRHRHHAGGRVRRGRAGRDLPVGRLPRLRARERLAGAPGPPPQAAT